MQPQTLQADSQPGSILIVRLSAHGDVVQTIPLLTALKAQWPEVKVGWLVEQAAAPLLENHPLIDRLHVVDRKKWLQQLAHPLRWPALWQAVRSKLKEIREENYQISLDAQGLFKSAIWPFWLGIPKRYGFKATRENADWFYNHRLPPHPIQELSMPAASQYIKLAQALGAQDASIRFVVPPVDSAIRVEVSSWLETLQKPRIVLAPFTRWSSKLWPLQSWALLIGLLQDQGFDLVLIGGPEDREHVSKLMEHASRPVLDLVGRTPWPYLYALFSQVDALVGLDSAPAHIANSVGKPVITTLFGPTAPQRTGPIGSSHRVLAENLPCQPCFEKNCPLKTGACMTAITPEQVAAELTASLREVGVV